VANERASEQWTNGRVDVVAPALMGDGNYGGGGEIFGKKCGSNALHGG